MTVLDLRKIWVEGSQKYRNPALDVPADFSARRLHSYDNLQKPFNPRGFAARVKRDLEQETKRLNKTLPTNSSIVDERLLLCLFGLGTNVGLSAIASASEQVTDDQLSYKCIQYPPVFQAGVFC